MFTARKYLHAAWLLFAALDVNVVHADAVTDWNIKTGEIIAADKLGPAAARRAFAVVQTSVYGAVNAVTLHYPPRAMEPGTARGGSIEAAVASASRTALLALVPARRQVVETAYQAAIAHIPEGAARNAGIAVGQKAAAAILAIRADDLAYPADNFTPPATQDAHVQTPAETEMSRLRRKPWLLSGPGPLRPVPPPAESSPTWARDFNEVKNFGGKISTRRTAEQTALARFWEDDSPGIFYALARSVAQQPGREVTQNARLYMALAQAVDDSTVAVLDAKYAYNIARPTAAIHAADKDNNEYTVADAAWVPLSAEATHPEYPCSRCIEAAAVGAVIKAEVGKGDMPQLQASSMTAPGVTRSWGSVEDMIREAGDARVFAGVDYRTSTVIAMEMGKQIGELAVTQLLVNPPQP